MKLPRNVSFLIIGAILLLALSIRLIGISFPFGDFDEGGYISTVRLMSQGHEIIKDVYSSQFPLFAYIGEMFYKISPTIVSVRLFPIISSLVIILISFLLTRKYVSLKSAIFVALYLTVNSLFLTISRTFQADVPYLAFTILSLYFLLKFNDKKDYINFFLFSLFFSFSILTKINIIFTVPVICYLLYIFFISKKEAFKLLSIFSLVNIVLLLLIVRPYNFNLLYTQAVEYRVNHLSFILDSGKISLFQHEKLIIVFSILSIFLLLYFLLSKYKKRLNIFIKDNLYQVIIIIWSFSTLFFISIYNPFFPHHSGFFIVPMTLLSAYSIDVISKYLKFPPKILFYILLCYIIYKSSINTPNIIFPKLSSYNETLLSVSSFIKKNTSEHDYIISDDPIVNYLSDRNTPPFEVDTSFVRIHNNELSSKELVRDTEKYNVKLIIFISGRLKLIEDYSLYLNKNYIKDSSIKGVTLYIRK